MSLLWVFTAFALGQTLPQIQAETLSGVQLDLPSSLTTTHTVLVLSFQREHQEISNAWRPHLAGIAKDNEIGWYELAFLDVSGPVKLAIGAAMDLGIRDDRARAHLAPVWSSHDEVRSALGIAGDDQVALAVVDKSGSVVHLLTGPPSDEAIAGLKAALP